MLLERNFGDENIRLDNDGEMQTEFFRYAIILRMMRDHSQEDLE